MRFVVIDKNTLKVINAVEWVGGEWLPPKNTYIIMTRWVEIGDTYDPLLDRFTRVINGVTYVINILTGALTTLLGGILGGLGL